MYGRDDVRDSDTHSNKNSCETEEHSSKTLKQTTNKLHDDDDDDETERTIHLNFDGFTFTHPTCERVSAGIGQGRGAGGGRVLEKATGRRVSGRERI